MQPLMRDDELEHFQAVVERVKPAHVVEFGCGGSTVWLADRVPLLESVEHNSDWFYRVAEAVTQTAHVRMHFCPPDFELDRYKFACPEEEMPAGLTNYLNPQIDWSDVSLVFVDGLARGACLSLIAHRVKAGTTVLLHDYLGRELWYDWALHLYERVHLQTSLLELRR